MENSSKKTLIVVGVIALIVGLALGNILFGSRVAKLSTSGSDFAGAVGNLLAEDYDPYVQYNGGFNTAKGITNSGTLTQSGASTLSGATTISGAATFSSTLTAATSTLERTTLGGSRLSTTTVGSIDTLKGVQMQANNLIDYVTGLTAGITLTLQATSSWPSDFIPNTGDETVLVLKNATSTGAGVPLTIALGSGLIEQNATSTKILGELDNVVIRLIRQANTDVTALMTFFK